MPNMPVTLIKGDSTNSKTDYRDALPVNMTGVLREILGARGYMISHPGLSGFAVGAGLDRGGVWNERLGEHFRVSGQELVTLSDLGAVNSIGAVSGSDRSSFAYSFNTQAVVEDGKMWLYDGTTFTQITDTDLGSPIDICWVDGYYFLTDGEYLYHTLITDEYSIDPLQYATAEFSPDPTLGVAKTTDNQVIVFGRYSTEWFVNRATPNFAFQRLTGKSVKSGIVGTHCKAELEGRFYVMGGAKYESVSIHVVSGGRYQSIASREVDKLIAEYTESQLSESIIETRTEDRDKFIIVHLPNETLIYNASLAERVGNDLAWSIVKSDILGDTPWRGVNGVFDPRIGWVYGDKYNSNIGLLDHSVSTQYGDAVEQILYSPLINLETASIDKLSIESIPGHQINPDNVTVALSLTYDGLTYGKEWWVGYGQIHNYGQRFIVNRLGYVRDNVGFKLRCASPERLCFALMVVSYG